MSDFGLQLRAALVGDFDKEVKKAARRTTNAKAGAVFDYADEVTAALRQDFSRSGIARASLLLKTWHSRHYANKGTDPAALVYSSMATVVAAFEQGALIRSHHGLFIPLPNPDVWVTGRVPHRRRGGAESNIAIAERKFGPLQFVYRPGQASLLVADVRTSNTKAGQFRKATSRQTRAGRGLASIIVFFLVPEARLKHRLHGNVIRERARRNAPARIEQLYLRHMERDGDAPLLLTGPET